MFLKYLVSFGFLVISFSAWAAPVNVNTASVEEISSNLSGIGPTKAAAISEHCKKVGCDKLEDLLAVKGIGSKTLDKIADDLVFKDK